MNYVARANRPNPAAIFGAIGVPAIFGAVLITGLAVTGPIPLPDEILGTFDVKPEEVPPPPPEPVPEPEAREAATQTPVEPRFTPPPRPDTPFEFNQSATGPITDLPDLGSDTLVPLDPVDFGTPGLGSGVAPVTATPRGEPGRWITDNDYRPRWVREEMSGRAGFALEINAEGRVSQCTITRSTGHAALDEATCRLLERRARFNPAQDSAGNPVAGSYTSSVNWQIPD